MSAVQDTVFGIIAKEAGIVIIAHGDPQFGNGWEKRGKPTLLDGFMGRRQRERNSREH